MDKRDYDYFVHFPYWLEDIVDAFLFTKGVDVDSDPEAADLKDRAHALRWDIRNWISKQERG